ncbi:MAG: trans-aconitate 2-methyltransferase [SAR202 cluster bacterium Io17-Chloro-G9]|nr:MAG: trans-aconitate 2-methyltransferase [SAR202 cluster bacterium Io17-Chloro-G9]
MTTWNPTQYLRFGDERIRPALDLLTRIYLDAFEGTQTVYDLGCGTGAVTAMMKERWPDARVTGVDSSPAMLDRARKLDADVHWLERDLNEWKPEEPASLLYSNAVLHWLDDHETLFPQLMSALKPGGVLAVQMPHNFSAPSHTLIAETVRNGAWREELEPEFREQPVLEPWEYYDILSPHATTLDLWETTYLHVLQGEDPVVEWTKGSILGPILDRLDEAGVQAFLDAYRRPVGQAYPQRGDGKTVLPFKRLFLIATR